MNRRSFFRSILVASVAPSIFVPKLEHGLWRKRRTEKVILHNRAYETAKYEFFFYDQALVCDPLLTEDFILKSIEVERSPVCHLRHRDTLAGWHRNWVPYPVRGNEFTPDGKLISIPPFVKLEMEL